MVDAQSFFSSYQSREVIPPHLLVAEPSVPLAPAISEKDLHDFWRTRRLSPALLRTNAGEFVEVVHPGEYNRDAGPDFCRATIKVNGKILHGDVEFHLEGRDWFQHGHHADPAYNAVILHVALRLQSHEAEIVRENGLTVPQVLLDAHDLPAREPEPRVVLDCPLSRTAPEKILATVRRAGQFRLEQKTMAFAEQLLQNSWDQAVYQGIAEALGYDKNQEAFRLLAKTLPVDLLFSEMRANAGVDETLLLESLLFGVAGFLEGSEAEADNEIFVYLSPRRQLWERLSHPLRLRALPASAWRFFRLRPANFPPRRLAGLASLLRRFSRHGMVEQLLKMMCDERVKRKAMSLELLRFFAVPAPPFWERRCDFRNRTGSLPGPRYGELIGSSRALDIVVNVVLPALLQHAAQVEDAHLATAISELYACLPSLQPNLITRRMSEQLSQKFPLQKQVGRGAHAQQGLIYLQKLLCRPLRCEICLRIAPVEESQPPSGHPADAQRASTSLPERGNS